MNRIRTFFMAGILIAGGIIAGTSASRSSSSTSTTASLEGVWEGILTQPGGPYEKYTLRIEIRQDGIRITGVSRIGVPGTEWYGQMPIEGTFGSDTLRYKEGWMVAKNIPSEISWCLKNAVLHLIPTADTVASDSLIGPWESPPCLPGTIRVGRVKGASVSYDTAGTDGRFRPDSLGSGRSVRK